CLANPQSKNPRMSSYLLGALGASSTCPGCLCRDRVPRYPSDLSDAQWAVLRPEAEQVMAEIRRASGRPMVHDLRVAVDAIGDVVRNGIEWRASGSRQIRMPWGPAQVAGRRASHCR